MRVLQLHTRYRQPGGEDTVVEAEAALLRSAGHEVVEQHAHNPSGSVAAARALARSAWNREAARAVAATVRHHRPDVAHVHNTWYALSASVIDALKRADVPVVMTLHNYRLVCANGLLYRDGGPCEDCVGTHPWHGLRHRCYRNSTVASAAAATTIAVNRATGTWRRVDLFLALTEFARRKFIAGGLPAERIRVKPNAVADPGARPAPPSASPTVLYVGRLSPEKGLEAALEAWGARERAMELVVVGDGPSRTAMAERYPTVRFTGRLPHGEVVEQMRRARALIFPSTWYETFGLVVVEAMAAGLPVLASDLGVMPEIVGDLGADWLVPPGRPGAWPAAMDRLDDPGAVDAGGTSARRAYEHRFSEAGALAALESAYEQAARHHRSSAGVP